ncbi:MAG: D-alanyl-D-alanine carboxypeptidase [Lachnospiraceae bacterium]|nr:D-alanyl-D-alanine carboxypeptidase [Lachnospiraceae bacterium]
MKKTFIHVLTVMILAITVSFSLLLVSNASEVKESTSEENAESKADDTEDKKAPFMETAADVKDSLGLESPSALLMELSSGKVLYEKDADSKRRPASVTKLMTMLLAFEKIDSGAIKLEDTITVSEHAASMGGSQVYLEPGEQQTVNDILKCMIVSSANDAAVAMAEFIGGTEPDFVNMMNDKAASLGMTGTHFENACGLEAEGHLMTSRDIAILSRELLLKHPSVTDYTTIWMDTITHHTVRGDSEFGLANTNKFLKKYEGANGLKTGYTSVAGFSMSATATRNGTTLIAVVMGSKTKDIRYKDAATLLDYGFNNCRPYSDDNVLSDNISDDNILKEGKEILVVNGTKNNVSVNAEKSFKTVLLGEEAAEDITKKLELVDNEAPIKKGEIVAKVIYEQGGNEIGSVNIIASEDVSEQKYKNILQKLINNFINIY